MVGFVKDWILMVRARKGGGFSEIGGEFDCMICERLDFNG